MISYCVFNVGERRIGIALTHVREIIEHHLVVPTPIPLTPAFVHGLFNLRGQVLPYLDLSTFVGAEEKPPAVGRDDRAVIVERGNLRFATTGRRIDTLEADPATFAPLAGGALHPALEAEARTEYGNFQVIHLDRLEACLSRSLKLTETTAAAEAAPTGAVPARSESARPPNSNLNPNPESATQTGSKKNRR
jgi:chemotaxis signal transduction protein